MFAFVNEDCIGCGVCAALCPHVFRMENGTAVASAQDLDESDIPAAAAARDSCPVCVIDLAAE